MDKAEIKEFFGLLDAACDATGKERRSNEAKKLFLDTLGHYGMANLRGAILAHIADPERGRFAPTPADITAQIQKAIKNDGRPDADEAWPIACKLADEDVTQAVTDEIMQAWVVASEVMPDRVGARMAFKSAYQRLVDEARSRGESARWFMSYGRNPELRQQAIEDAVRLGRIQRPAQFALPDIDLNRLQREENLRVSQVIRKMTQKPV